MARATPWWTERELVHAAGQPVADADAIIARLGLGPHPEGGWYRETYRHVPASGGRGAVSQIYYLLKSGERSRWHRLDADEIWHFYLGGPLSLFVQAPGGVARTIILGTDFAVGQHAHAVVPAGAWQAAEPSVDTCALVGCTVAPAFRSEGFELAPAGWRPGDSGSA